MGRYQFLIYLIPVLLAVLQTAYRAYQKKRAQLDAEAAERFRQQTILRTGRDPLAEQAAAAERDAQRREAEIIAERQEALRQLRRQQEEARTPSTPPPVPQPALGGNRAGGGPGAPVTRELWPGGPVIVIGGAEPTPAPAPQRQDTRSRAPQPVQTRSQQQGRKKQNQRQQDAASTLQSRQEDRHDAAYYQRERSIARMQASSVAEERAVVAEPVFTHPSTPAQWRAAFIAAEVLGTPVSMRDPQTPPGGPSC